MGKVFESIINTRLKSEIEDAGDLSNNQFGFRSGRSTLDAIEKITEMVRRSERKIVAAVFVDVKNAFNTANWKLIMQKIQRRNISSGLVRIIASYLSDRKVIVGPECIEEVGAGVPQGSVLGPTLWNILYDDVMHSCDGIGVELICYADDLAVIIKADKAEELVDLGNRALYAVKSWMDTNRLEMAPEKTSSVVFSWSVKHKREITFTIGEHVVRPAKHVKYLGVTLDFSLTFSRHVESIAEKAEKIVKVLTILLGNTTGPSMARRRVLAGALQNAITYAAPIWVDALQSKRNVYKLRAHQRAMTLRCCSGYCTVSAEAAAVLAGMIPIDLLISERAEIRAKMKENNEANPKAIKREAREATMRLWQAEWSQERENKAAWTRRLIKDLDKWVNRKHGEMNYHLTQAFTGHGCFQQYLWRIKKAETTECTCGGDRDDAEHTLFVCSRFLRHRIQLEAQTGERLEVRNMVEVMLKSKMNWKYVQTYVETIMLQKEREERQREQLAQRQA